MAIAFVEDNYDIAKTWSNAIQATFMEPVSLFFSGDDLLRTVESGNRFFVYVVDLDLGSGMNGYELTREIRRIQPDAKIIGYSTVSGNERDVRNVFLECGADDFVNKRSGLQVFLRVLEQYI